MNQVGGHLTAERHVPASLVPVAAALPERESNPVG
jgi:hypothetical protein